MKSGARKRSLTMIVALGCAATLLAACSNSDDDSSSTQATPTVRATNTAVPSATPSVQPTATPVEGALVQGVLIVYRDVAADRGDALGAVPPELESEVGSGFDRSLAHADWTTMATAGAPASPVRTAASSSASCRRASTRCWSTRPSAAIS